MNGNGKKYYTTVTYNPEIDETYIEHTVTEYRNGEQTSERWHAWREDGDHRGDRFDQFTFKNGNDLAAIYEDYHAY